VCGLVAIALTGTAWAQSASPAAPSVPSPPTGVVTCASEPGARAHCVADTAAGVVLVRTLAGVCLLGRSWGYDATGVWVADGCAAEFQTGPAAVAEEPAAAPYTPIETWGEFDPGQGFLIGRSKAGELAISAYALARYMNQNPAEGSYTDHLGNERSYRGRNDIYSHRIMVFLKGWLATPRLIYAVTLWTVNTTDQRAIFGVVGYQFHRRFSLYAGLNGNPGTRSLMGSHPYWLAPDRVMADEFFRPFFGSGVWATGELIPGLWYTGVLSNNNSALGVKPPQLDRSFTTGASVWWMPTTKEFGPRGAYGDWEFHEKVATRVGVSTTRSPEQRFTNASGGSDNTTLRLADSVNLFDTGALAPGVTVDRADYRILSFDAGMKYRGIFLHTEVYNRWLDEFRADGVLPVSSIHDTGFQVQAAFFPIPKVVELYAATSQIYGDTSAGFDTSSEYLGGANYYPFRSRNYRLNLQLMDVNRSPVSSTFGYYVGGQTGTTFSTAFSIFF
jgi:hypothetical protein